MINSKAYQSLEFSSANKLKTGASELSSRYGGVAASQNFNLLGKHIAKPHNSQFPKINGVIVSSPNKHLEGGDYSQSS